MYNRYIPQSDGTYRRSRVASQDPPPSPKPQTKSACPPSQNPKPPCTPPKTPSCPPPPPPKPTPAHQPTGVDHFLKSLLPPGFDTADLIIVLLLLLLAGDCQEDRTTAMLTLVLYLFL